MIVYGSIRPVGRVWRGLTGGTWVTGDVDEEGSITGDDVAFVYQDLKTAIVGKFRDGVLVSVANSLVHVTVIICSLDFWP